ncbi:hypothetical protein DEA8626_02061 [Defluviimonas aquaemixtae]|uniref:Sulfotransferase domain-containing protein n=1 Tax=Albidovulum aquaemixtae TaxID=1542388 RepID=A0A2R8B7J8_9RHOB|nr:hypothetical protein [Defluviimonas aquaemixtae]SPH18522.1 hypothetical protein DEA8626_02061 [Defluviimonas aquaemixtae]
MELILHLGVHRTGSTALQRMLNGTSSMLEAVGVRFWGPQVMRIGHLRDFVPSVARAGSDAAPLAQFAPMAAALHDEFALAESEGVRRLIVSDENLLGAMRDNYDSGALYPDARAWLIGTAALFPRAPNEIYIGLRDYAEYAVSIYSHLVLRRAMADFDSSRFVTLGEGRGWSAVLADLVTVFPNSRVRAWRYERRRDMVPGVARAMAGQSVDLPPPKLAPTGGLSRPALDAIRAAWSRPGGRTAERQAEAAALAGIEGPTFDPFDAKLRARLTARFETDWRRIASGAVPGVTVFDPAASEAVR